MQAPGKDQAPGRAEPAVPMDSVGPLATQSSSRPKPGNYLDFFLSFPTCVWLGHEVLQIVSSRLLKPILLSAALTPASICLLDSCSIYIKAWVPQAPTH